ncbi:undecaprenyl-phosphate glucose phosphotransferase [Pandoraea pulmonicola]|uniref:Colanic biosynthesis UDP-glucose lipid carrier transferase n=2 Tax=Pandoraea pulmonicola TaxID=93221 RepID=A0AAJ4ZDV5_PANPU|nr:undecaprenyl-phosphate glucose phosphotransferase [Pandoraea pulmonicola]SUA91557.1 Putative colanic biosynthesis UDP-glucose lipid carrier transferase [Pandoraea pulmonicola]
MSTQTTYHHRLFMAMVGGISAVLNAGAFFAVLCLNGQNPYTPYGLTLVSALGVTAFIVFTRFHLFASARSARWMLGRGAMRWCRVLVTMIVLLFLTYDRPEDVRAMLAEWAVLALPLQVLGLATLRGAAHSINNAPGNQRHAAFFGLGPEARKLYLRLRRSPILGIQVAGYYNDTPVTPEDGEALPPYLGRYADAAAQIQANAYGVVFIAIGQQDDKELTSDIIHRLYDSTAAIYLLPEFRFAGDLSMTSTDLAGVPLLALHDITVQGVLRMIKRGIDVVGATMLLAVLWPVLIAVAIAVRLDSPGPILFRQRRYGERGQPIVVHKFRSMRVAQPEDAAGATGGLRQAHAGDSRITPIGRYLRRTSLDELPQLFDVLSGEMSLVGPRPHAEEHNEMYRRLIPGYMLRHSVKPGITGWAQINGLRGETDTPDKMQRRVEYDRYYITNWSLWLDIKILLKTIPVMITGRNAI